MTILEDTATFYVQMSAELVLTLMGEDAVESPKEMFGKDGDVYKLSMDTEPSGRNSLGWEGHLYISNMQERARKTDLRGGS